MIDLDGQVVVVTGAGRGLGHSYAIEFARRGAMVVVNDAGTTMAGIGSDPAVADRVVEEIGAAGGLAAASHHFVDSPEGARGIVETAVDRFGRLDALVSNAGIFQTLPFEELTATDWRRMLSVHLDGGFYLSQASFEVMKAQGYGRFVFVISSAGLFGQPNSAHYAAAKAGLLGLMNVIAIEGAEHGILANSVLPFGLSRMVTETLGADEALIEESAFLRAIDPELVVPMVVYLASSDCELTHQSFSACAGRYARAFVGLGEGWLAEEGASPTADDIAGHIDEVSATDPFIVPGSIFDEIAALCDRLGITA
jgi:NAD(P)-dependent dehydrogenase (short-subunit alcohol dehydrogenase family)